MLLPSAQKLHGIYIYIYIIADVVHRPAPECADVCNSFQVEVRSGDIIMIDTHRPVNAMPLTTTPCLVPVSSPSVAGILLPFIRADMRAAMTSSLPVGSTRQPSLETR